MIKKALEQLESKCAAEDFARRLIFGVTLALRQSSFEKYKEELHEFIHKITVQATAEECDQIYQSNLQFFPLTK